jgi:PAT family beta-lactamase induction signal transducer AmpG
VGVATATIGLVGLITGTFYGGASTDRIGLTRSLWLFGMIQAVGFLGYIAIDQMTPGTPCAGGATGVVVQPLVHRLVMYLAILVETFCQGMATGAFGVMLLRMTQKQFSATQYALFSSLFGLPRLFAGPVSGFLAYGFGWRTFFWITVAAGIPGMLLLARFVPPGVREPVLEVDSSGDG